MKAEEQKNDTVAVSNLGPGLIRFEGPLVRSVPDSEGTYWWPHMKLHGGPKSGPAKYFLKI